MQEKPLSVFVSSTSVDLFDFRAAVIKQLLEMALLPLAMEYFGSRTQDATEVCVAEVDRCDLFVGIYAFRYGYVPDAEGSSITEQEYIRAREQGKRCLCYFADEALRPREASEPTWKQDRLNQLKQRIDSELVRSKFSSPTDLAKRISTDISWILRGEPLGYAWQDVARRWFTWQEEYLATRLAEQEAHSLDVTPSPLMNAWDAFTRHQEWHLVLEGQLNDLKDAAAVFPEFTQLVQNISNINTHANYRVILSHLRTYITADILRLARTVQAQVEQDQNANEEQQRQTRRIVQILLDLHNQVKEPTFSRCFLVLGSMGAGKSHFVASLLANRFDTMPGNYSDYASFTGQGHPIFLLPLDLPFVHETLAQLLDRTICTTTKINWRNLQELDRFLQIHGIPADQPQLRPRLIITIDDFQHWLYRNPNFQSELLQLIESHSALRSVYWLILLQDTEYDKVTTSDHARIWQDYSYVSRPAWLRSLVTYRHIGRYPYSPPLEKDLPHTGGWMVLDQFNARQELGITILREQEADFGQALSTLNEQSTVMSLLSNPFIAWALLLTLRDRVSLANLVNLNFIDFVTHYWDKRRSVLQQLFAEQINSPNLRADLLLNQMVNLVAFYLTESGDFAPTSTMLIDAIVAAAQTQSELQQRPLAERALHILVQGNLVTRLVEPQTSGPLGEVERIRLGFEPFWELRLAEQLLFRDPIRRRKDQEARLELETWFGTIESEPIREGSFEFLLLLLEQKDRELTPFLHALWLLGLENPALPLAAVWFAGSKALLASRHLLSDWATQHPQSIHNNRVLFAFMHFVFETQSGLDAPKVLALLQPYYAAINDAELAEYFRFHLEHLFARQADNEVILACLPFLDGCEVMKITADLATVTMAALIANVDRWTNQQQAHESLLSLMIRYLQKSQNSKVYAARGKASQWDRSFFREWLLFEFCDLLVEDLGHKAFDFLYSRDWYYPQPSLRIALPISLEMEREANIALGKWYRWAARSNHEQDGPANALRYLALVTRLANSPKVHDIELAFHLIRHTSPTEGEPTVAIAPLFHPLLRQIFLNTKVERTVDRFFKLFERNLEDIGSLTVERQPLLTRKHLRNQ